MKKLLSIIISLLIAVSSLSMFACSKDAGLLDAKNPTNYSVTLLDAENGSVAIDKSSVELGESVTFTILADDGYVLEGLYLNGGKANVVGGMYTIENVLRDYTAIAVFAKESINIIFDGEGTTGLSGKVVNFGDNFGTLPEPTAQGKYFIGWKNGNELINEFDSVLDIDGEVVLTAEYGEYLDTEKAKHIPFSISASYYDMAATKYGVAWHTKEEPINPVLLATEGDDFSNAKSFEVETFNWMMTPDGDEWICSGVVEDLKFNTTYSVKFGDYSVDAWSEVYTFTTREEYPEDLSFVYMTDTQQVEPTLHWDGETYSRTHYTIKEALTRFPEADFITHGGDFVQEGAYACQWESMLYNFKDYLFDYPMQVVNGNHERIVNGVRDNPHNTDKIFNIDYPGKDNPNYDMQNGVFYSFDYGPMHYVVINSNEIYVDGRDLDEVQVAWIKEDVEKANANPNIKWVVAMTHHAPYPNLLYDVDVNYAAQLVPLLDSLDVDLLLYGHNHALTVTYPIVWDNSLTADATGMKAKVVTKNTEEVSHDGVIVEKYIYADGTTDYGTVFHQTGAGGIQSGNKYLDIDMANYPYWRIIKGGGKDNWQNISISGSLSMYTYVEVSNDTLVARTYGVDTKAQMNLDVNADVTTTGHYLYGFMLTR